MKKILFALLQLAAVSAVAQTNYAINLNGSTQYVSIGNSLPTGSSYTKEAWVYATSLPGSNNIISSLDAPFWINGGNLLAGQAGSYTRVVDGSSFPLNQWVHVAVTYDAPSTTMRLYRNGILVSTNASVPGYTGENNFIGSHFGSGGSFPGYIDEVRIWNTARTQAQIKASMYTASLSTANLVAYYRCNDGSGSVLTDAKGSFNGTIQNAAGFVASPVQASASAIAFDGINDRVTIPDNNSLDISTAITLEAWVYPTKNSGIQNVLSKSSNSPNNGYIFPRSDDGWGSFSVYLHIGGSYRVVTAPFPSLNTWHHLAATFDGTTIRIYLDGIEVNSLVQAGTIATNTNALTLGDQPGYSEFYGGYADEFRVWNVARTQPQILANMNKQLDPATQTGLVSYYKVNQGVIGGTNTGMVTLVDQSGSNNGTLANFAWSGSGSNFVAQSNLITLPVQWQSFTATKQNERALLQWSTATEQNTKEFIVQRSSDATNWQNIAKLAASGNSSALTNYSYEDNQPYAGNNYYRILQTDIDGRFSYSDIKLVQFNTAAQKVFTVQANPVLNKTIQLQVNQPTLIMVYTLAGKLIRQQQTGAGSAKININGLAAGVYLVKAQGQTEKVVIE